MTVESCCGAGGSGRSSRSTSKSSSAAASRRSPSADLFLESSHSSPRSSVSGSPGSSPELRKQSISVSASGVVSTSWGCHAGMPPIPSVASVGVRRPPTVPSRPTSASIVQRGRRRPSTAGCVRPPTATTSSRPEEKAGGAECDVARDLKFGECRSTLEAELQGRRQDGEKKARALSVPAPEEVVGRQASPEEAPALLRARNPSVDKPVVRRTRRATTIGAAASSFSSPSRLPSIDDGVLPQADREAKQAQALEALFKSSRSQRPLDELAQAFLRPIISREGASFFSFGLIAQAVEAVASSGLADASGDATPPSGSQERCEVSEHFVSVVRWLSDSIGVPFTEIAGQILWRNRRAKVLQRQPFRRLTKDLGWMDTAEGPLEPVEQVFRCLTADTGRRMGFRQWQKVISLIQKNPILQSKIRLSDADRLFYGQCRSGGQAHKDIGMSDYKDVLFELAEASGIHPSLILMSVGSHARRLVAEVDDKEEAVTATRSVSVLRRSERSKTTPGGLVQAARPLQ